MGKISTGSVLSTARLREELPPVTVPIVLHGHRIRKLAVFGGCVPNLSGNTPEDSEYR